MIIHVLITMTENDDPLGFGEILPTYEIDLSLPPIERYKSLAESYRYRLRVFARTFDLLVDTIYPGFPVEWVKRIARLLLRRLYTHEETEEIRGISQVTGIEMYLLVSLNVILDVLMGCSSGTARSSSGDHGDSAKMLHFRTLDWGMGGLRDLLVQINYVRSPDVHKVLATSITYVGFVGVLTGVRQNLSLSLNFRPNHDTSGFLANYRFYFSHVLVLLGIRRSISSLLREYLLPPKETRSSFFSRWFKSSTDYKVPDLSHISATLPRTPTTACYLVFCDGESGVVFEKDHRSAVTIASNSFVVATNSDAKIARTPTCQNSESSHMGLSAVTGGPSPVNYIIEDGNMRRAFMQILWDKKVEATRRNRTEMRKQNDPSPPKPQPSRRDPLRRTRSSKNDTEQQPSPDSGTNIDVNDGKNSVAKSSSIARSEVEDVGAPDEAMETSVSLAELIQWVSKYPITNEMTHFAAIMDPVKGSVAWVRKYPDVVGGGI